MIFALELIGVVVIVLGVIGGFLSGSIGGFLTLAIGSAVGAMSFFALARVLSNQDDILYRLQRLESPPPSGHEEMITCEKCGKQYAGTMSYCSWCGYRDQAR